MNPLGLKSDAPMDVIWDIMRCWVRTPFQPPTLFFPTDAYFKDGLNKLIID